jgi:hypothetical protein
VQTLALTQKAADVLDRYLHLKFGSAVCNVPYFNNKTMHNHTVRVEKGKGSPDEIVDELRSISLKSHIEADLLADQSLKKLLVDHNVGIDCSGFAYHLLDTESIERNKGSLRKQISFIHSRGILGKVRSAMRPAENSDVATLADDRNSKIVPIGGVRPGDMITMLELEGGSERGLRNHLLVVHEVNYHDNMRPIELLYSHSIAYPDDGLYGTGVRQGAIEITGPSGKITDQKWLEEGKDQATNPLFLRALKSRTEIRRLNWFD